MRIAIALAILLSALGSIQAQSLSERFDAHAHNRRLGQAINLGNTLEAPNEGDWGFTLKRWHFEKIAEGGFDSVRVPIKWSGHAQVDAPYTIDESFFQRIDWVIGEAQKNGLAAIVNVHHYDEIHTDIPGHRERLANLWSQISERYKDEPRSSVYFEIMNEPNSDFTDSRWRSVFEESLATIRESNPDRMVIVGGINWNSASGLARLRLPADDPNLIGTFHYYDPFRFTHQGAEWVDGSEPWLGNTWSGTDEERANIERDFDAIQRWSQRFDRPVLMGEFGAYSKADMDSRAAWTEFVTNEAEEREFSWGYWEFGAGFGAINRSTRQWIAPIYDALSPTTRMNLDHLPGLTVGDADQLSTAIASGADDPRFDVDGDGTISREDMNFWIYFSNHELGDADLDGLVNFDDFLVLSGAFGKQDASWSDGDFDANGQVGFADFLLVSGRFGKQAPDRAAPVVPEPSSILPMLLGILCLQQYRKRR